MTAPRLEIDLAKIHHNAHTLVTRLADRGISVTGVTKAALGAPEIAATLVRAGVTGIGDSRIDNIESMRRARIQAPMTLIRSPMLSQVGRVVRHADVSCNTEIDVIAALSAAAGTAARTHGILLMVELGDLREGIMPADLMALARQTDAFAHLTLEGIGANLACHSGVVPSPENMDELTELVVEVEAMLGRRLATVSGGNSANLAWALGARPPGRIDNLRLGEAILLGREPLHRGAIEGLHTDAVSLVAEVIESKVKPSRSWGETAETAFGPRAHSRDQADHPDGADRPRTILAVGEQDTDPSGLVPPAGTIILGASSDHLIVDAGLRPLAIGTELRFELGYGALVRAMTSPFVTKVLQVRSRKLHPPVAR